MPRNRWIYVNGVAYEPGTEPENVAPLVMKDIAPYKSMIDGRTINSRSAHREHLRDHGCVEIGNDSSLRGQTKPIPVAPGLKETVIRAVNEYEESHRRKR